MCASRLKDLWQNLRSLRWRSTKYISSVQVLGPSGAFVQVQVQIGERIMENLTVRHFLLAFEEQAAAAAVACDMAAKEFGEESGV